MMTSFARLHSCKRAVASFTQRANLSTNGSGRLVISRRAWQDYAKSLSKRTKPKAEKPEDKPWPTNVKIAGYAAGGILIPYCVVWFIVCDPTLRGWFQNVLPLEKLREHFGDLEWDAQSYSDQDESLDTGYYQYPRELSFEQRKQEADIENRENDKLTTNLYLLGDHEIKQTKQVDASLSANRDSLLEIIGSSSFEKVSVAVDFEEDATMGTTDMAESSLEDLTMPGDSIADLRNKTHTYSTWYHVSNIQQQQQDRRQMSQAELDLSRLEHTIATLENNLKDPTCTRDIDDMTSELREAKRQQNRLRWKRRLGMT